MMMRRMERGRMRRRRRGSCHAFSLARKTHTYMTPRVGCILDKMCFFFGGGGDPDDLGYGLILVLSIYLS